MMESEILIREYVTALRQKNASIFIGSGMSVQVFNRDWKKLIMPYARKIKISIKKEGNDYPFIAQSYVNCGNDVIAFKKSIGEKFKSDAVTKFHKAIARLPIQNYWTTNYDSLIENALAKLQKHYDIIYDNSSFSILDDKRDHIVYKCHGDYKFPKSIIITQSDFERYKIDSNNFENALNIELASSTILFLGYSLSDPDIKNIIATLTAKNKEKRNHFMITKRKQGGDARQQELLIKDLERYGIHTCLIDKYNEIEVIIKEIEQQYMANKILISGSAVEYTQFSDKKNGTRFYS